MDDSRHYDNRFSDFPNANAGSVVKADTQEIQHNFKDILAANTKILLNKLEENKKNWTYKDDYSVYTGTAGIAYMFYRYGRTFGEPAYVAKATELLKNCVCKFREKWEVTFLTGICGPLALNAVVSHDQGNTKEAQDMILKVTSLSALVLDERSDLPDELLYGRAGYLFSLLFLNEHISPCPIKEDLIKQVIALMIKSGNRYAATKKHRTPLMYAWYDTEYLGGAHGLAGILYLLLQAKQYLTQEQLENEVKPALHFLISLQYKSGNFPASADPSERDELVHWCHGAPGMTMLFCLAYQIFKEEKFLEVAKQCGEVVWQRGLLRKGYSICHGVSGNAYTFLCLFQETKDVKYLYRACKFAEWCTDYGTRQNRTPDRPFSLFEGLAGVIYFLIDMQEPAVAKFPGYTV